MLAARRCVRRVASACGNVGKRGVVDLRGGFSFPAPRTLGEIAKVELLENEVPARVREIWLEHHEKSDTAVATTMTKKEYTELAERTRKRWARRLAAGRRS